MEDNNMPVFDEGLSDQLDGEYDGEPGATIMWFGKYASDNKRFDELDESYRRSVLKAFRETDFPSENLCRFQALHNKYNAWLDVRKSPLSTIIWFGKYKGHEIRVLYNAVRRWRWHLANNMFWREDLKEIEERYEVWLLSQPKRLHRRPLGVSRDVVNPVGESLHPGDDGPPSDIGEYEIDDFVVEDDMDMDESGGQERSEGEDGYDDEIGENLSGDEGDLDEDVEESYDERLDTNESPSKRRRLVPRKYAMLEEAEPGSSDEEFPSLETLIKRSTLASRKDVRSVNQLDDESSEEESHVAEIPRRRRRRLVSRKESAAKSRRENRYVYPAILSSEEDSQFSDNEPNPVVI